MKSFKNGSDEVCRLKDTGFGVLRQAQHTVVKETQNGFIQDHTLKRMVAISMLRHRLQGIT
jgi:hypothetical protein